MAKTPAKSLSNFIRLAICVAAMWFVLRGVKVNDRVVLLGGVQELTGTVTDLGDRVSIRVLDGSLRIIALDELAVDEQGKPRIEYGLRTAWQNSRGGYLLLAVLIYLPTILLQGIRLQWLLRAQTIGLRYWECVKLSVAGNFLNFATPLGSNAGDVFKAVVVTKHTDRKTEAVATIALDRVIGLGTLLLCVGAITIFCSAEGPLEKLRPYVLTLVGIGVVSVMAYLSPFIRPAFRATGKASLLVVPGAWLESAATSSWFHHIVRIDRAARELARRRAIVFGAVFVTVLLQTMAMTAYFCVAVALQLDAHLGNMLEYYAYFYTGTVVQALPGPPQGLGTVELAYRYFFAPFGSVSQIVCMAFMIRLMVLACALPGLLVTLTGSYKPRQMHAEVVPSAVPGAH